MGLSDSMKKRIDEKIDTVLKLVSDTDWEVNFIKDGVIGMQKPESSLLVRGDILLNYSPTCVFKLIMNDEKAGIINPQLDKIKSLERYDNNTVLRYMLFKQVWPLSPRDTVSLSHWRLLPNGKIIILTFSWDGIPEIDGIIRANLEVGALVISPMLHGCLVQYILHCDLKGTIPEIITNYIANLQPMNVANIRNILDEGITDDSECLTNIFLFYHGYLPISNIQNS